MSEPQGYQPMDKPPPDAAYPPPAGAAYPPPPQQQQTTATVVVQRQPVIQNVIFRDVPVVMTDAAGNTYQTQLDYKSGTMTWVIAAFLFLFGFWCCFFIPFFIDAAKDVYHINPNDGTVVGVYKRL